MAEQQLRRALTIAEGSPMVLVTRPILSALLAAGGAGVGGTSNHQLVAWSVTASIEGREGS